MKNWNDVFVRENLDADDYAYAREYVEEFRKEFASVGANEIGIDDIAIAVLNGISQGKIS